MTNKLYLIKLENQSIYEQLQLEEALLRADDRSFCIINKGSSPSIVMGISSKKEELIDLEKSKERHIPIIQRFSGGGCVVVDHNTYFVSFILSKEMLDIPLYPEPILRWANKLYQNAFQIDQFDLRENDFVIGAEKCGGNAQYIQKNRHLLHTSFLWDYNQKHMDLLHFPKKVPDYRQKRNHDQFLCKLKDHTSELSFLSKGIEKELESQFSIETLQYQDVIAVLEKPYRKSMTLTT